MGYDFDGKVARARAQQANAQAVFHPQTGTPQQIQEEGQLPAIEVAGVLVFAYVKDGEMRVSVDLDTTADWLMREDSTVPLRVTVQGDEVFRDDRLSPLR